MDVFKRYSRQIFIEEVGVEGQRNIMQARVLVVGAGGLGSPIIQYLTAAGIGKLGVIDFDTVELHNLNRQVIYSTDDLGKSKVACAKSYAEKLNPSVQFVALDTKLTQENIETIFQDYDLILDGSDNFKTRYLVNDTCVRLNIPLIYGSILGFEGQFAVFNYKGSKDLRAIFPEPPFQEDVPDCDSNGVLGPLPGIIGNMMAMECLKIVVGMEASIDQLLIIDARDWVFIKIGY